MKFGLHYLLSCSAAQSPGRRYQDTIEQAIYAESLGFESIWPVEHHFNQALSALPCPTLLLAAVAARTSTLRLGTAIIQLGLNHPLRIAEEMATLDVLSGGRVECGVGRGSNPAHFAGFHIPLSESRERMEESLRYLQAAFSAERFSFQGRYFRGEDICLVPKPEQSPHPPLTLAANSADTAAFAGQHGYPIMMALHINPLPKAKELVNIYRNAAMEAGHPSTEKITLLLPMYVGQREDQVKLDTEPSIKQFIELTTSLLSSQAGKWASQAERQQMQLMLERVSQMNFQSMNQGMAIFATPEQCVERLKAMEQELGVGRIIGWFNLGGVLSSTRVMGSMKLFAEQVMPHFN